MPQHTCVAISKRQNETTMTIEVFQGPGIIYLVVNVKVILFSFKSKQTQNGKQNVII